MIAAIALAAVVHVPHEHYHRPSGPPRRSVMIAYTVRHGDTLWDIARRYSGGGRHWRWILQGRDMTRPNPYRLHAGQVLAVPDRALLETQNAILARLVDALGHDESRPT